MQQEEDRLEKAKQEKRAQYDRSVTMYVQNATETSKEVKSNVMSAVKEGLQAQKEKKRKRQQQPAATTAAGQQESTTPDGNSQNEERPNSLCTLSGDVVVEETKKGSSNQVLQIQSQSDFATLALFLDKPPQANKKKKTNSILYYEVCIVTGGLAQIGWADMTSEDFHPNTEEGEGVGDDKGSYGYDGSRGLKFHSGKEEAYEGSLWKAGDVVGCQYNLHTGDISYSLNGKDLGVAFQTSETGKMLFPAISCNGGEILELHIQAEEMEYLPSSKGELQYLPVKELIAVTITSGPDEDNEVPEKKVDASDDNRKPAAKKSPNDENEESGDTMKAVDPSTKTPPPTEEAVEMKEVPAEKKDPVKVEALDLEKFNTAAELEPLGLDRLKGALMAIGVKCG